MRKEIEPEEYVDEEAEGSIILNIGVLIFNMMLLNVMWFLCSLPIVTIGASTAALDYTNIKMRKDEGDSIVGMFFHSFAANVRQAVILSTGMIILLIILAMGFVQAIAAASQGSTMGIVLSILVVLMLFIWFTLFIFLFFVQARFDNPIPRTLTNAVYLALTSGFNTFKVFFIAFFLLFIVPTLLWALIPVLFPLVIFFAVPLTAYLEAKIFNRIFEKYIPSHSED